MSHTHASFHRPFFCLASSEAKRRSAPLSRTLLWTSGVTEHQSWCFRVSILKTAVLWRASIVLRTTWADVHTRAFLPKQSFTHTISHGATAVPAEWKTALWRDLGRGRGRRVTDLYCHPYSHVLCLPSLSVALACVASVLLLEFNHA